MTEQQKQEYIDNAMSRATLERVAGGMYHGSIPGYSGVWVNATTALMCKKNLRHVLNQWVNEHITNGTLPEISESNKSLN